MNCDLCDTKLDVWAGEGQPMHRECLLRSVLGGIGHLLDHNHFCINLKDPDAGLNFRTSALLVDVYVANIGIEEATRRADLG